MNRIHIKSTCKAAVAASLILALLARVPFVDGLVLHDHSDHGIHSHAVTHDDLYQGDLHASWYRYHDDMHGDEPDDKNNDSDGGEYGESLFILVNNSDTAMGIHGSSGPTMASIQHSNSKVLPRSMLSSDPTAASRFLAAPWPGTHSLRPACALDALLQSSHALLL